MDLSSNFLFQCTNIKFIYIIIHSRWSLAIHEKTVMSTLGTPLISPASSMALGYFGKIIILAKREIEKCCRPSHLMMIVPVITFYTNICLTHCLDYWAAKSSQLHD